MADIQTDRKQQQRIHLTVVALFVLAALMFVSAAFLKLAA